MWNKLITNGLDIKLFYVYSDDKYSDLEVDVVVVIFQWAVYMLFGDTQVSKPIYYFKLKNFENGKIFDPKERESEFQCCILIMWPNKNLENLLGPHKLIFLVCQN